MLGPPGWARSVIRHQRLAQRSGRRPAVLGRLRQGALDRVAERSWHVRPEVGNRSRRLADVLEQECHRVAAREWDPSSQHLIREHAKRVDVAPAVDFALADRLLRRM